MRYSLRASLLDRPGSLSALTAAIGRVGGDIASLQVLDREDGVAVDDLCITCEADADTLRRACEQVPGVIVEWLREVGEFPDEGAPLALAARIVEHGKGAVRELVEGLPAALPASWCLAVARGVGGLEVLTSTPGAPALASARITWLPLPAPRRLERAEWMPPELRAQVAEGLALAAAPLGPSPTAVLVGRRQGPRWSGSELRQLGDLARIAVATEMLASSPWQAARLSVPAGRAASAGTS